MVKNNRIIQLSRNPIDKDDFVSERDFIGGDDYAGFVGTIADSVSNDTDKEEDIELFVSAFEKYGLIYDKDNNTITFKQGFSDKYFESKFNTFKELSAKITREEFKDSTGTMRYHIEKAIDDALGFYIYLDWDQNMDSFVRTCLEKSDRDYVFYLGNTIAYD